MNGEKVVNGLWIGNELSTIQIMCLNSWIRNGYAFNLYTYEEIKNLPDGVNVLDAKQVLGLDKIFTYKDTGIVLNGKPFGVGSYAGFSDWFRARLLFEKGGIWVDLDVVCLKPFYTDKDYFFVEQKHPSFDLSVATCFIYSKNKKSLVFKEWLDRINKIVIEKGVENIYWGEIGPDMMTDIIISQGLTSYVEDKNTFCPIDYTNCHEIWTEDVKLENSFGIHLWNAMWDQHGIDKNAQHVNSLYDKLKEKFL